MIYPTSTSPRHRRRRRTTSSSSSSSLGFAFTFTTTTLLFLLLLLATAASASGNQGEDRDSGRALNNDLLSRAKLRLQDFLLGRDTPAVAVAEFVFGRPAGERERQRLVGVEEFVGDREGDGDDGDEHIQNEKRDYSHSQENKKSRNNNNKLQQQKTGYSLHWDLRYEDGQSTTPVVAAAVVGLVGVVFVVGMVV
ncbi:hypothetical protein DFH27DRAFT_538410 [Peziza echinospora]|nr:hypothetical protein DFH27DRAFT_538410 [Peziza echinospora]